MRMTVTLYFSCILLVALCSVEAKIFDVDDDESCCRLEWKPVIENGESSHFIPLNSIPVQQNAQWSRYIFQFDENETTFDPKNIGIISSKVTELPRKFEQVRQHGKAVPC